MANFSHFTFVEKKYNALCIIWNNCQCGDPIFSAQQNLFYFEQKITKESTHNFLKYLSLQYVSRMLNISNEQLTAKPRSPAAPGAPDGPLNPCRPITPAGPGGPGGPRGPFSPGRPNKPGNPSFPGAPYETTMHDVNR